jgi:hypothetical protein
LVLSTLLQFVVLPAFALLVGTAHSITDQALASRVVQSTQSVTHPV